MSLTKKTKKRNFRDDIEELVQSVSAKPALMASVALMATIAGLKYPFYAFFFLVPLALLIGFFSKSVQWAILIALIAGFTSVKLSDGTEHKLFRAEESACGTLETILPRSNGFAFIIDAKNKEGNPFRVRLTEKRILENMPSPGDSICYEASFYPVKSPTVPGAFDTKSWLQKEKLSAYGKILHFNSRRGDWTFERSFFSFRKWIKDRFDKYLEPAETGLLLGLLAGDRSGIPESLTSDFQRSGLVHVLAISGFHVVLLSGILMVFLKATRIPHNVARIIAVILLFIYIPVTGSSPAVRRAVFMFTIPQLGILFERKANTLNSLGAALFFILVLSPQELFNAGFQLSASATAGILIGGAYKPFEQFPDFIRKNTLFKMFEHTVLESTYVTLTATLATAPFLIYHFGTLSPTSWLGNIIVVPAISYGMQAGLFALLSPFDFLQQIFSLAAQFFLRLASLFTHSLSDSTIASITVGPYPTIFLLLGTFSLILLPVIKKNSVARIYCVLTLLLFSAFFAFDGYRKAIFPSWNITAIDVGQGDSFLIETPSGRHILIDAGDSKRIDSGKKIIIPFLQHQGIKKLDALVITHSDLDHFGGAKSIVQTFPVAELWISKCSRNETKKEWRIFLEEVYRRNIPVRTVHRGFVWQENLFEMTALHPSKEALCSDLNRESIAFRGKGLGHSALLVGDLTVDGEREILSTNAYLKSDILKLGHHGSKTSSGRRFLEEVSPQRAIISSGFKNRFHHPHKQVTSRLDSLGIPYMNTATHGTVTVTFTENSVTLKSMSGDAYSLP